MLYAGSDNEILNHIEEPIINLLRAIQIATEHVIHINQLIVFIWNHGWITITSDGAPRNKITGNSG